MMHWQVSLLSSDGRVSDYAGSRVDAMALAVTDSTMAVRNARSYQYFIQDLIVGPSEDQ